MATAFQFGVFDQVCSQVAYPFCPLVGSAEPTCYSRNIELGQFLVFQPATLVIYVIAIIMTLIMVHHIKSKYTAVGRKEIVMFFYLYLVIIVLEFVLVSNLIPSSSLAYLYLTCVHFALQAATFFILMLNGLVAYQFIEDGTKFSIWSIRAATLLVFVSVFLICLATFLNWAPLQAAYPFVLFIVFYIMNLAWLILYLISQLILVVNTLDNRWPVGDLFFGVLFFTLGQIFVNVFSIDLCVLAKHYIDGLFFGATFTLLSVMMVYKYFDSITKDDLEFAIPTNKLGGIFQSSSADMSRPLLASNFNNSSHPNFSNLDSNGS